MSFPKNPSPGYLWSDEGLVYIFLGSGEWLPLEYPEQISVFVKAHAELLEEVKQLRLRRAEAVAMVEKYRVEVQEYRATIKELEKSI